MSAITQAISELKQRREELLDRLRTTEIAIKTLERLLEHVETEVQNETT